MSAGVEYAITPNFTVKAEYLYANLGSSDYMVSNANEFIRATPQIHIVRLDVNYLFSTGPSAVVARYGS